MNIGLFFKFCLARLFITDFSTVCLTSLFRVFKLFHNLQFYFCNINFITTLPSTSWSSNRSILCRFSATTCTHFSSLQGVLPDIRVVYKQHFDSVQMSITLWKSDSTILTFYHRIIQGIFVLHLPLWDTLFLSQREHPVDNVGFLSGAVCFLHMLRSCCQNYVFYELLISSSSSSSSPSPS